MKTKIYISILIIFFGTALCFIFYNKQKNSLPAQTDRFQGKHVSIDVFSDEKTIKPPFEMPLIMQPEFPETVCSIDNYGAIGDGQTMNTEAFAKAISDCKSKGGGVVKVPNGKWLTGAIKLGNNINLKLENGSEIIFSSNPSDYLPAVFFRYEGIEYYGFSPFIYAENATNIGITGEGKLKGQGELWWKRNNMQATYGLYKMAKDDVPVEKRIFTDPNSMLRPAFIGFINCNSILLEDFTILDSPRWTIDPVYSSNIIMRNLKIKTGGLNTDGIAIDSSKNILIEDSFISSGDDSVVIKSGRDKDGLRINKPSENIIIRNCDIAKGHGIISIGSETSGGIRNVFAYNLNSDESDYGFRTKSSVGRGGVIENIWIENLSAKKIKRDVIQLTTNYDAPYSGEYIDLPTIKNIHIENFNFERASGNAINIVGTRNNYIENISIENLSGNSKNNVKILNAKDITIERTSLTSENTSRPTYDVSDSKAISLKDVKCASIKSPCFKFSGQDLQDVLIKSAKVFSERDIIYENGSTKDSIKFE